MRFFLGVCNPWGGVSSVSGRAGIVSLAAGNGHLLHDIAVAGGW